MTPALLWLTSSLLFPSSGMLVYLGQGSRSYGLQPSLVCGRTAWEFQAVLRGEIALRTPNGTAPQQRRRLWVFPPGHLHGWTSTRHTSAEVAVFHFPHVPEPLRHHLRGREFLDLPLTPAQGARLRQLTRLAKDHWNRPGPGLPLCHEQILLELSLLALDCGRAAQRTSPPAKPIDRGLLWYSQHMENNPGLDEVARAAKVSPAHLRRLFHRTFQMSPKSFLDQLRFQRAMQLMADASQKLETVSIQCGFGSASAFSRAFKNKFGTSPDAWRNSF